MFFKKKIDLLEVDIDQALYYYYLNVKGIELGRIKYEVNKSTGKLIGAKANILKEQTT
jgi:hypothetical protein